MSTQLEIKSVHVNQAVKFENKVNNYLTSEHVPGRSELKLKLIDNIGVLAESDKDSVIIPFSNINGIFLLTEHEKRKKADKAEQDKLYEANRPVVKIEKVKTDRPIQK